MGNKNICLTEYHDTEITLTNEDINFIQNKVNAGHEDRKLRTKISNPDKNLFKIRPQGYVGLVQLPSGKRLEIKPKVGNIKLLKIWNYIELGGSLSYQNMKKANIEEGTEFLDIIGYIFYQEVRKIIRRGLYKTYIKKEDVQKRLKGKIRLQEQINTPTEDKFHLTYEEITKDNDTNKLLLYCLNILKKMVRNKSLSNELGFLYQKMRKEISYEPIPKYKANNIKVSRLNSYYSTAIDIAQQVVNSIYYKSTEYGESKGHSFLINMNTLFEKFVRKLLKDAYPEKQIEKTGRNLVKSGEINIKPDILIKSHKREIEKVGDVKYKPLDVGSNPSSSDFYQSIAYGLAHGVDSFLIHPGKGLKKAYEMINTEQRVFSIRFNLEDIPEEGYIERARKEMKEKTSFLFEKENQILST